MTKPLDGVRVAVTENRYPEQLVQLLERQGASVLSCPLLKETPVEHEDDARRFIEIAESGRAAYIVFYTGVGVDFLFKAAQRAISFNGARIVARGPKAVNALKRAGVTVDLVADAPTTEGIVRTLLREDLPGKTVLVQLYGQESPELVDALTARGAEVVGISLYSYTQSSDTEAIAHLVRRIAEGGIDAITFTSATQVPFFFKTADQLTGSADFRMRLQRDVAVASVGEVTSRALRQAGVEPSVEPVEPKMGPMVKALIEHFEARRSQG